MIVARLPECVHSQMQVTNAAAFRMVHAPQRRGVVAPCRLFSWQSLNQ
jgi:hypothetical protein